MWWKKKFYIPNYWKQLSVSPLSTKWYVSICITNPSPLSFSFGGTCEAYQGGSTLCDGELAESVDIYFINARSVNTQAHLTSQLNAIISPVFTIASTHCQKLTKNTLSLLLHTLWCQWNTHISSFHLPWRMFLCPKWMHQCMESAWKFTWHLYSWSWIHQLQQSRTDLRTLTSLLCGCQNHNTGCEWELV